MKPVFKIILLISLIIFSYESCSSDSPCDAEKKKKYVIYQKEIQKELAYVLIDMS